MGVVDYFRSPKRQWYWYRNAYKNVPPPVWSTEGSAATIRLTASKTTIGKDDGTDDLHLAAAVVDKDGKEISNSPDVKLEIVSGPGEFPTGSSILFLNGSDIVIRDGKAAIEFRSYYTGKTVIRATSPGLKEAEITIVSKGAPAFKPGTSTAAERPYLRYRNTEQKVQDDMQINLLAERPTHVSSSTEGHSPRLANDGDSKTFWQSGEKSDGKAWWQVDMENIYSLSEIKITFKEEQVVQCEIQVSEDGNKWTTVCDQTANTSSAKNRKDIPTANNKGRFLRIIFNSNQANIADIQAYGKRAE